MATTYTIKKGDTLSKIAKRMGTTVAELAELNGIANVNKIRAGATIKLPTEAPTPASRTRALDVARTRYAYPTDPYVAPKPATPKKPVEGVKIPVVRKVETPAEQSARMFKEAEALLVEERARATAAARDLGDTLGPRDDTLRYALPPNRSSANPRNVDGIPLEKLTVPPIVFDNSDGIWDRLRLDQQEQKAKEGAGNYTSGLDKLISMGGKVDGSADGRVRVADNTRSPTLTASDTEMLVYTLLGEAEGEGTDGMRAVASTIVNRTRAEGFPDDPVSVVSAPKQFDGGPGTPRYEKVKALYPPGSDEYAQAMRVVASHIAAPNPPDATGVGAVFFDTSGTAQQKYAGGTTTRIGNHFFYAAPKAAEQKQQTALEAISSAVLPASPFVDDVGTTALISNPRAGGAVAGIVFHHTAGSTLSSAYSTAGKTGAHFYIDTDGTVHQAADIGSRVIHIRDPDSPNRTDIGQPTYTLTNDNTIGVEIVAADENHVTQAQLDAAASLVGWINTNVGPVDPTMIVGHGDLQGGDAPSWASPFGRRRPLEGIMARDIARMAVGGLMPYAPIETTQWVPPLPRRRPDTPAQQLTDDRAEAIAYARENARQAALMGMNAVSFAAQGETRLSGGFESDIWADGIGSLFDDAGEISSEPVTPPMRPMSPDLNDVPDQTMAVTPRVEWGEIGGIEYPVKVETNQPLPGALVAEARRSLFNQPPDASGVRVSTTFDRSGEFNRYTLPNLPSSILTGIAKSSLPMGKEGRGGVGRDAVNAVRPEGDIAFVSRIDARPEVPGSMPAAPFVSPVAGRLDAPLGSMPAAPSDAFVSMVAGRPDAPVGSMPAAEGAAFATSVDAGLLSAPQSPVPMDTVDVQVGSVAMPRPRPATVYQPYVYQIDVAKAAATVREHAASQAFGLGSIALFGKDDNAIVAMIFEQKDKGGNPMIPADVVYDKKTQTVTTSNREYAAIIGGLNEGVPPEAIPQLDKFVRPILTQTAGGFTVVGPIAAPVVRPIVLQRKTVPIATIKEMMSSLEPKPVAKPKPPSMATVKPAWGASQPDLTFKAPGRTPQPGNPKTVGDAAVRTPVVETWSPMAAAKPVAPVYKIVPAVYKTVPVVPPAGKVASGAYNVTPEQRAAFGGTDAKSAAVVAKAANGTQISAAPAAPAVPAQPQTKRVLVTPARRIEVTPKGGITVPERRVAQAAPKKYTAGGRTYVVKDGMMVNEKTGVKYARTVVYGEGGGDYGSSPGQSTAGLKPGDRVYNADTNTWGLKR